VPGPSAPAAGDPWRDSLSAVFARNCSSCHLPSGSSGVNLSSFDHWQTEKKDIHERVVVKKDMPPQGHVLSDADREAIRAYTEK
jgi:mono/diheme cytochrome c family protein